MVSGFELRRLDALPVHERAVGAVQIPDLEAAVLQRNQPAVDPRDQCAVDAEVGAGGAANRPDPAGQNPERLFGFPLSDGSQNPHKLVETLYSAGS